MTLKEIREEAWDIARDTALVDADRLWTTREMNRYINRIYRYIARETRCIRDSQTASLCNITVAPRAWATLTVDDGIDYTFVNDPTSWLYHTDIAPIVFPLDARILDIDEVKWTSRQWRLTKVSVSKWQGNPWWEQVVGMPTEYCLDYNVNSLAINFRETITDTLRLCVRRLPLVDLINNTDVPELRTHYHDYFINGVLWQMYSKQDADTIDLKKAEDYRQAFLADIDEIKQQEIILDRKLNANHSLSAFR